MELVVFVGALYIFKKWLSVTKKGWAIETVTHDIRYTGNQRTHTDGVYLLQYIISTAAAI